MTVHLTVHTALTPGRICEQVDLVISPSTYDTMVTVGQAVLTRAAACVAMSPSQAARMYLQFRAMAQIPRRATPASSTRWATSEDDLAAGTGLADLAVGGGGILAAGSCHLAEDGLAACQSLAARYPAVAGNARAAAADVAVVQAAAAAHANLLPLHRRRQATPR